MISAPLALATVVVVAAALAFWLDHRVPALSRVGASMMAIFFGALLSNLGLVPAESPVYDLVGGPITLLSVAWLLLSVDLRDLPRAGPRVLGAFGLALVGTVSGAFLAALLFGDRLAPDTPGIAAALTGTYTGGSVNFVSVGRAVGLTGPLFAGLGAADAIVTALWLGVTLLIPVRVVQRAARGTVPEPPPTTADEADEAEPRHPYAQPSPLSATAVARLLAVGMILLLAAEWLGARIPGIPVILWLTTLALVVGHTPGLRSLPGAMQFGSVGLHLFFVLIGIMSRIPAIIEVGPAILYFTLTVVAVHGVIVFGIGRLARLDVPTISVASQAAVGGPSSALAVAVAREWRHLVLPGVIIGLLGYAVGTYLGLGVAWVLG